jgi:hypothetical protein
LDTKYIEDKRRKIIEPEQMPPCLTDSMVQGISRAIRDCVVKAFNVSMARPGSQSMKKI